MEPDFTAIFLNDILPQLIGVVAGLIPVLVLFLKSKMGKAIASKIESAGVKAACDWASDLAFNLVLSAAQTQAEMLKKSLADGKIDEKELAAHLEALKKSVLEKLQAATVGRLLGSGAFKSSAEALDHNSELIEAAVKKAKALIPNP